MPGKRSRWSLAPVLRQNKHSKDVISKRVSGFPSAKLSTSLNRAVLQPVRNKHSNILGHVSQFYVPFTPVESKLVENKIRKTSPEPTAQRQIVCFSSTIEKMTCNSMFPLYLIQTNRMGSEKVAEKQHLKVCPKGSALRTHTGVQGPFKWAPSTCQQGDEFGEQNRAQPATTQGHKTWLLSTRLWKQALQLEQDSYITVTPIHSPPAPAARAHHITPGGGTTPHKVNIIVENFPLADSDTS